MNWATDAGRVIVIAVVGLLMIPVGLGLVAVVCLGVVVAGVFVIGKLSRQR